VIYINQFLDKIRVAESRNDAKLVMSLRDAKNLHNDVTKLLLALHDLSNKVSKTNDVTSVSISGEDW